MYKPDLTLDQRRALLQANCEGVEERTYSVPISQEERSNLLEDFLDLNKDLKSIEEEKASIMKDYKKKLEDVRTKQLELSEILESNSTIQKSTVYKIVDREELFALASNVLECKFLLLQYAYFMNGDKILKAVS